MIANEFYCQNDALKLLIPLLKFTFCISLVCEQYKTKIHIFIRHYCFYTLILLLSSRYLMIHKMECFICYNVILTFIFSVLYCNR